MKLVAMSDTTQVSCQTDQTTLVPAIAAKAPWMPTEGVVFVLADDEGGVVEPEATEAVQAIVAQMLRPALIDWPVEAMVSWLNQKFV
jgi:hypothetical protein